MLNNKSLSITTISRSFHLILVLMLTSFSFTNAQAAAIFSKKDLLQAGQLRQQALRDNSAYQITESLTTEVGARLAGSKGNDLAVAWAERKLKALGFDKVWLEPVSYPSWIRHAEKARIVSPFPQPLQVTALGFSVATAKGGIQGPIIQFDSVSDLENADAEKVAGKIVFISERMKRSRDGHGYGVTVKGRVNGASIAATKGAIALVIRSVGTDSERLPHTGVMHYQKGVKRIPAAALSNPDADLLLRELQRNQPVIINLDLQLVKGPEKASFNVIGEITGSSKSDEIVAIGAHLDSWDLATGAIDDAAGVGIVTAAASLIGKLPKHPARSIRVILFANEEMGLWGGKAYAKKHVGEIGQYLIAGESDFGAGLIYKLDARVKPEAWKVVQAMATLLAPLGIELGKNQGHAGPDFSPFQAMGLPAFDLKQDGTRYFDWHHTANDTFDKIVPREMAQNVAAYAVIVYLSAEYEGNFGSPLPQH